MLEEDLTCMDKKRTEEIKNKLFIWPIDIEHIQSYLDSDLEKREDILGEWGDNINSLGNLVLLEENINRSIGNKPTDEKVLRYQESKFNIIHKFTNEYNEWNLVQCQQRKKTELDKIKNYIFNI